jgi:hypothetical protein
MEGSSAPAVVQRYIAAIGAHLDRLASGHDPLGHLFGIERLARGARAEWPSARDQPKAARRRR